MEDTAEFKLDNDSLSKVRDVKRQFESWITGAQSSKFRARMERNFQYYSGVDGSQWPKEAKEALKEQQRPLHTFNFCQGIVKTTLGQLEQQPFETHFDPIDADKVDETGTLQELFDYNYERGDWEFAKLQMKRDGLIIQGVAQMFVDYKHDPLGDVGLKAKNPFYTVFDPYWQTNDMADCRGIYSMTWMTAAQIKRDYRKKNAQIINAIERDKWADNETQVIEKAYDRTPEYFDTINTLYKVIEFIYTERQSVKRVFNTSSGKFESDFDAPDVQSLSDDNFNAMMRIQGSSLILKKEERTICKIITICPALGMDLILEEGMYPLQLGRLPFVTWSAENVYGERQGVIDLIADAQSVLNKRESVATYILGMQGNPNYWIEEGAFTEQAEKKKFKSTQSNGGQVFDLAEGGIGKIQLMDRGAPPNEMWAASDRAERHIRELSGVVSASQGRGEGANESGILFDAKREQALVQLEMMSRTLKRVDQELGDMFFYAAKQIYSGPTRQFKNKKTGTLTTINKFGVGAFGEVSVEKNIAELSRHNVLISEAPMGTTKKREFLSKYIELIGTISNPMLRAMIEPQVLRYADLPEDITSQMQQATDKFLELQNVQADLQIATANQQIQQLGAPPPQQAEGGGFLGSLESALSGGADAVDVSKMKGLGNLPNNAGIAGGESAVNNSKSQAPSDLGRR